MKSLLTRCLLLCLLFGSLLALTSSSVEAEARHTAFAEGRNQEETRSLAAGVRAEKVSFTSHGLRLAGRVLIPKLAAGKRAPAMLLLSGSNLQAAGAISLARAPVTGFDELSAFLSANGLVVFSYDTQCNGESECKRDSTPQDYAADSTAAFLYLTKRPEVDASKIIVLGHDEGGTFAASVVGNLPTSGGKVSAVVLVNTPGRTYGKILRDSAEKRLKTAGRSAQETSAYLAQFDSLANSLSTGNVDFKVANADEKDELFSQFARHRQYVFHLFVNDPLQMVRSIEVPLLIVQGAKDAQIGVRDAQYLKEAVDRQYHKDASIEVLPAMDHWMREQKGAVTFRDEESTGPLDPAFTALLNAWIAKRLK